MRRMTRLLSLMLIFSLMMFSCPLAEGTDAPTGTPAPTPMMIPSIVRNDRIFALHML